MSVALAHSSTAASARSMLLFLSFLPFFYLEKPETGPPVCVAEVKCSPLGPEMRKSDQTIVAETGR